ncbi:hypothetical protein [Vibrio navarrensis]|uniref:hypothetical protein n=1 Tax=Vibrio navarrensis TaxID=29495 RepID=UPI001EEBC674|nr:hypothetical protein [Vibrio navarrensis]
MKTLIVKNTLFTVFAGFSIVWLISLGKFFVTASQYPVDYLYLVFGVALAILYLFIPSETYNETLGTSRLGFTLHIILVHWACLLMDIRQGGAIVIAFWISYSCRVFTFLSFRSRL